MYEQQLMNKPHKVHPRDKELYEAYAMYERETEAYDIAVCSAVSKAGEAMPANYGERMLVNKFSHELKRTLMAKRKITHEEWREARAMYFSKAS